MINSDESENRTNDFKIKQSNITLDQNGATSQNGLSLRDAIENSIPSGIIVVDETEKQVYVNQAFCRMVGWNESELLGKQPPFVYWAKQDIDNITHVFKQTFNNKPAKEGFDLVFCHRSGRLIPVNVVISPFRLGNKTFLLANVIDITDRWKIEEALIHSQLLLRSSIESQKDTIIFSIDTDYNYMYFNKAHLDAMKFAYNKDVKVGMNILECITKDDDRKLLKDNFDHALNGGSHSLIQTFGETNIAFYEVFYNPIRDEKDKIIGCAGLARNISERILAEQALKDSEIKFKEIIDQINDGIVVFDEQGEIIIWNKGAEQICGLKAKDVLNKYVVDVQVQIAPPHLNDRTRIEKVIKSIITRETPEVFIQIRDSEIIPFNSDKIRNIQNRIFPIKLNGYDLFCAVIRDTTEIKRYEKELLRLSTEKDKFYSTIAQYLYTPFNVFSSFSRLMAEELDSLPIKEIQKMAVMMSKSATNLYNLLDNLLQWTKMHQGKIPFEPQTLNFKAISQDAVSILKPHANAKNIRINHSVSEEINVFADIFMLKTILRNLVSNAIRFANNDGQIDILAQQTSSVVIISVLDNGITISPGYLTKLFDVSQIQSTLGEAEEKGITLGLLLCKEFVEKHGGEISAKSEDGKGNEFKFTLPILNEQIQSVKY